MNSIDIGIAVVLLLSIAGGIWRGFILQAASIVAAVAAFAVAHLEYGDVSRALENVFPHSTWVPIVSYLLVFLVIWGAIIVVAHRIRTLAHMFLLGAWDRLGGAAIGLVQGLLLVELLLYLGKQAPAKNLKSLISHSQLAPTFVQLIPYLHRFFPHLPS